MKGKVWRILIGCLLLGLQLISSIGNAQAGYVYKFSFNNLAAFTYDLIIFLSAHLVGIIGLIVILPVLIGLFSSDRKTKNSKEPAPPSEKPAPARSKQRYCKVCGGAIDIETKKCSKCGKQYFRIKKPKAPTVLPWIIIVVLIGALVFQAISHKQAISYYQSSIYELEDIVKEKNDSLFELISELANYERELEFFDKYAVITLPFATDAVYHRYSCPVVQESDEIPIVGSIVVVENQGYTPCEKCYN